MTATWVYPAVRHFSMLDNSCAGDVLTLISHAIDTGIREELVDEAILALFKQLQFSEKEWRYLVQEIARHSEKWESKKEEISRSLNLQIARTNDRMDRLTDAYLEQALDREAFERRKESLLFERKGLEEQIQELSSGTEQQIPSKVQGILELANTAWINYKVANSEEKRDLVRFATSNRLVDRKNVELTPHFPLDYLLEREKNSHGACGRTRTYGLVIISDVL